MVFDPLNRPMIAHYDLTNSALRFSVQEPGIGWVTTTVDSLVGVDSSIAIDPDTGFPAIAYWESNPVGLLRYAAWDGDSWNTIVVDAGNLQSPSLAFDPADGNPTIAYADYSNFDLKFAWHDGSAWQIQTVDAVGDVGLITSLAFNDYGTGFPSIAYLDRGFGGNGHLYFIDDPPATVPEPLTMMLLSVGLTLCASYRGQRLDI
jgi:hypothetical protein